MIDFTGWCHSAYAEVARINERREKDLARLAELESSAKVAEECVKAFPGRFQLGYDTKKEVEVDASGNYGKIRGVMLKVQGLSHFGDVTDIVDWLVERLPHRGTQDYPEIDRRLWEFGDSVMGIGYPLTLMAFLSGKDEDECKVIETGETTPVLKFVCPGSPELATP